MNNGEFQVSITDGGGKLSGYFEDENLVKITQWTGLSYGHIAHEFYPKDGNLFFAFVQEKKFADKLNESGEFVGLDHSTLLTTFEGRYYYFNRDLIHQIEKGDMVRGGTYELKNLMVLSDKYAEKLRIKH